MSIKPGLLKAYNFGSLESISLDLADQGLVAIYGENQSNPSQDSNGSGKSTIPDALCWCCFGQTARGQSGDEVINDRAKPGTGCGVTFTFKKGTNEYIINRYRKDPKFKNELTIHMDGKSITMGTTALTQVLINKILGTDLDTFLASIYFAQERMPDTPAMTDKQLKEAVETAQGMERIHTAEEMARKKYTTAEKTFASAKTALEKKRLEIDGAQTNVENLEALGKNWDEAHKKELEELATEVKGLKAESERIAQIAQAAFDKDVQGYADEILALDIVEVNNKGSKLEIERADMKVRVSAASDAWQSSNAMYGLLRKRLTELEELKIKGGATCPMCGNAIDAAHIEEESTALRKQIEEEWANSKKLNEEYGALTTMSDIMSADIKALQSESNRYSDLVSAKVALEKMGCVPNNSIQIRQMKEKAQKYKEISVIKNPGNDMLNEAVLRLGELNEELDLLEVEYELAEVESERYKKAAQIFSSGGVRGSMLEAAADYLNERTAKYLDVLTDGDMTATWSTITKTAKGEDKEKFSIIVTSATGGSAFVAMSGGERKKVRLATAWALQDLKAAASEDTLSLFIADEVDDAVDTSGLERLMVLLQEKAKEKGTVFVISHNDLSNWIPDSITIVKGPDSNSRLKV